MGDFSDARADLRKACELDPKSREVREMFDECKIAEAAEKRAQRDFYGAASGGLPFFLVASMQTSVAVTVVLTISVSPM